MEVGRVCLIFHLGIEGCSRDFGSDHASLGFLPSFHPGFCDRELRNLTGSF